jgi:DNA helicase-2/ATP-dependent DNA helicase PcrA
LVKRVLSLIAEGIDPSAILVLTFSNRAAGELADRLAVAAPDSASRIWIGTFHAFGLDLIRWYHDRLGLPSNLTLFDRSDAIEVLEEILPTLPLVHYRNLWDPAMRLRDVLVAISRAKDELADPARYHELAEAMQRCACDDKAREAAEKCIEVAQIYKIYEQAMHDRGAVDFGDLVMRPALLLEADAALRTEVQLRHRHVLLTCPPKTDPHVKLERWIEGRQGDEQEAVYSGADHWEAAGSRGGPGTGGDGGPGLPYPGHCRTDLLSLAPGVRWLKGWAGQAA